MLKCDQMLFRNKELLELDFVQDLTFASAV